MQGLLVVYYGCMSARLSEQELQDIISHAESLVEIGGTYRHYKGKEYVVLDIVIIESTNEAAVVYEAQYGSKLKFVRPLHVWLEVVEVDGQAIQRFGSIDE